MYAQAEVKVMSQMPTLLRSERRLSDVATTLLVLLLLVGPTAYTAVPENLEHLLTFESADERDLDERWRGMKEGFAQLDEQFVHDGRRSVRINRDAGAAGEFAALSMGLPINFRGRRIELRGWLRTEDVIGFAGLWLRTSRSQHMLSFDNMSNRGLHGTNDWSEYSVSIPLADGADVVSFGVLLMGSGRVWADTLQLLVDGKFIGDLVADGKAQAPIATPHDFVEAGSGVHVDHLSAVQIDGLHVLGRVWGFLKYHHPSVTSGKVAWDAELLRVLPRVLAAGDTAEVESRIVEWMDSLGAVSRCDPCAQLSDSRLQMAPRLEWLDESKFAGDALRQRLRDIYANRIPGQQFYVSLERGAGNPSFNEADYARVALPDPGVQLLGLFRFWNAVEYWFPYRALIDRDWTQTLREFIPRIAEAPTAHAYQLEMLALIARVGDSHANLWSSLDIRPPVGGCQLPVKVRFIEGFPVIAGFLGAPGYFQIGDVLDRLDGAVLREQIARWQPYYSGSNDGSRLRDIGRFMTRGECGPTVAGVRRENREVTVQTERVPLSELNLKLMSSNELEGDAFVMLSPRVAYLKISTAKADEISTYIQSAHSAQALVVDLRSYPSEFVALKLGGHLVPKETAFVRFTIPDLSNPGAFNWTEPQALRPEKPYFGGKVLVLVDESTQSQAEYTAMALRAAPHSTIVGSASAGANGNVSRLPLPGGLWSLISGIGIYYPDKEATQRVGIKPDIRVLPTLGGLRRGEDEVLAAALSQVIRGHGAKESIRALSTSPKAAMPDKAMQ